ncbi:unnamed protein product, partial [Allacma fusca]
KILRIIETILIQRGQKGCGVTLTQEQDESLSS